MTLKTVFVTGGTGYIGRALLARLLADGYLVRTLARDARKVTELVPSHPHLSIIEGHLDELAALREGVADSQAIFHLASSLRMFERKAELYRTNIKGTENLTRACAEARQKVRFIFTSSVEAVGPSQQETITAHDPALPLTDYGKSKLEAEKIIKRFCQAHPHVTYTILRTGSVYSRDGGIANVVRDTICKGGWRAALLHHTLKDHSLSLIHLQDLIDMLLLTISNPSTENKTYFAVGECLSIEKIISRLEEGSGAKREVRRPILGQAKLVFWNLGMRGLKRSDLLTYISAGGKRKFRNFLDQNIFNDLKFAPQNKLDAIARERRE